MPMPEIDTVIVRHNPLTEVLLEQPYEVFVYYADGSFQEGLFETYEDAVEYASARGQMEIEYNANSNVDEPWSSTEEISESSFSSRR